MLQTLAAIMSFKTNSLKNLAFFEVMNTAEEAGKRLSTAVELGQKLNADSENIMKELAVICDEEAVNLEKAVHSYYKRTQGELFKPEVRK